MNKVGLHLLIFGFFLGAMFLIKEGNAYIFFKISVMYLMGYVFFVFCHMFQGLCLFKGFTSIPDSRAFSKKSVVTMRIAAEPKFR